MLKQERQSAALACQKDRCLLWGPRGLLPRGTQGWLQGDGNGRSSVLHVPLPARWNRRAELGSKEYACNPGLANLCFLKETEKMDFLTSCSLVNHF